MANKSHKQYAEEWGVSLMTWNRWKSEGAPIGSPKSLASWLLNKQRLNKATRARMAECGVRATPKSKLQKEAKSEEGMSAEDFRDKYRAKLEDAVNSNDETGVKFWNEHYLKIDESIRKTQLHAQKLGIDNGTTLPRAEVERILRAVLYAGNANVNSGLTIICEHIAGMDDPAQIYDTLKPAIVGGRLFSGFDKVANIKGAPALPDWVLDCAKTEAKQYLGNSESLWTK